MPANFESYPFGIRVDQPMATRHLTLLYTFKTMCRSGKVVFIAAILILLDHSLIRAQNCIPGTLVLNEQSEIDSFPTNFPGCENILGSLTIMESSPGSITDLSPLGQLKTVHGNLRIRENDSLTNLYGIHNLDSVGGDLKIQLNPVLTSLSELINLKHINEELNIWGNTALQSLSGIDSLDRIGGNVFIVENPLIKNFNGFPKLDTIHGRFRIASNHGMTSLSGLESIRWIGGLWVYESDSLTDLNGLNSLNRIAGFLEIVGNDRLVDLSGLDSVNRIGWFLRIVNNESLKSPTGLEQLESINGYLKVEYNDSLLNLDALSQLDTIQGLLHIVDNDALVNLSGLDSIRSVGLDMIVTDNDMLSDISSLMNVRTVNGYIHFENNPMLSSLTGLDSLDHQKLTDLIILDNPALSYCHVKSICDYLLVPSNHDSIAGNATGCTDRIQVTGNCFTGDGAISTSDEPRIFPVPVNDILNIDLAGYKGEASRLIIINVNGRIMTDIVISGNTIHNVDVSELPAGMYVIQTNDGLIPRTKFLKIRN
jgi:hypothetical protein